MTKRTRIAVISDLHIGNKTVALDLCPHDLKPEQKVGLIVDYLKIFREHVTSENFKAHGHIDMLCVTGDISNEASPDEFRLAHDVVKHIADSLEVPTSGIYFVPGNHDVHWPVMSLAPSTFWAKYRYAPLLQDGLIFQSRIAEAAIGTYQNNPHFVAWSNADHLIVGINSAAFDSPTPDFGKHFGLVHKTTLDELDVYLESLGREKTQLRICLIHHHPVSYSDPQPNIPDFSTLTNSENFFKVLSNHRFDVVIHGHKHVPHILHAPFISNGHPVTVLGAGSFSARLESQWVGTAQNQFHVIEIEGRDPETDVTYGHVATWDFVAGRWSDSHSHIGLCATENFGSLSTPKQLEDTIGMHVDTILAQKEMCEWRDLVLLTPRLAHSNTKVAYEAFINVGKKRGLENFGEVDAKGRKWALYRPPTRSKK